MTAIICSSTSADGKTHLALTPDDNPSRQNLSELDPSARAIFLIDLRERIDRLLESEAS
jgi:hypothetical protein